MELKHTPGPWVYQVIKWQGTFSGYALESVHEELKGCPIATISEPSGRQAEIDANLALICAAPDMLTELRNAQTLFFQLAHQFRFFDDTENAEIAENTAERIIQTINKATGHETPQP